MESKKTQKSEVLSGRIRMIRIEKNLTLQDLADKVGIGIATLQRYETNKTENFKLEIIEKIADALNVSVDYLTGKSNVRNPYAEPNPVIYRDKNIIIRFRNFTLNLDVFTGDIRNYLELAKETGDTFLFERLDNLFDILSDICNFEKNSSEMLLIIDRFYKLTEKERDLIRSICEIPKE